MKNGDEIQICLKCGKNIGFYVKTIICFIVTDDIKSPQSALFD